MTTKEILELSSRSFHYSDERELNDVFNLTRSFFLATLINTPNPFAFDVEISLKLTDYIRESNLDDFCIKMQESFDRRILVNCSSIELKKGFRTFRLREKK